MTLEEIKAAAERYESGWIDSDASLYWVWNENGEKESGMLKTHLTQIITSELLEHSKTSKHTKYIDHDTIKVLPKHTWHRPCWLRLNYDYQYNADNPHIKLMTGLAPGGAYRYYGTIATDYTNIIVNLHQIHNLFYNNRTDANHAYSLSNPHCFTELFDLICLAAQNADYILDLKNQRYWKHYHRKHHRNKT